MTDVVIVMLCIVPLMLHLAWPGKSSARSRARFGALGLGFAFCFFAAGRIAVPDELIAMLPPWVPYRPLIIYGTGLLELGIAAALFTSKWRKWGGMAAAAVLILFFPANVYAAINNIGTLASLPGPAYLWIRGPLQLFLLAWTYWPIRWVHAPASRFIRDAGSKIF